MMFRAFPIVFLALASVSPILAQTGGKAPASTATVASTVSSPNPSLIPKPSPGDTLHVQSHIASFKMVPRGPDLPAGRLEFSFAGTVMISGLVPGSVLQTTGNIRKEYDNEKRGRQVYFGKGKILLIGKFRACQWFGKDLDLTFKGAGIMRITSEFDKNLDIGSYWFDGGEKNSLITDLQTLVIPHPQAFGAKAIKREDFEKQHSKGS